MKILFKILLTILFITSSYAQESFRVMTYNILNYPSKFATTRSPYFEKIIAEVNPDILIVQEMESITGVSYFSSLVLDTSYSAAAFIDGNDTDNALFYKHSKFTFLENQPIKTSLRDISQLTLVYNSSGDTLFIYSAHLKASSGSTNEQKRLGEVQNLRAVTDQLPMGTQFMVVGDFNLYSSYEPAYQALLDQTNSGYFLDPIGQFGSWHNSSGYRAIHTQSTRLATLDDDGSTGGLDDRFDFILVSQSILDAGKITYVEGSYTTYGNDGNHFNKEIIELPNSSVSDEIATALYYASDHLPVYADFQIDNSTDIKYKGENYNNFELKQNYPNPFNPTTTISYTIPSNVRGFSNTKLAVYDILGREVELLVNKIQPSGTYDVNFDASNLSSGIYYYKLKSGPFLRIKKMLLVK